MTTTFLVSRVGRLGCGGVGTARVRQDTKHIAHRSCGTVAAIDASGHSSQAAMPDAIGMQLILFLASAKAKNADRR